MAGIDHPRKDRSGFCQQQLCSDSPGVQCTQAPGKRFQAKLRTANQIQTRQREPHQQEREQEQSRSAVMLAGRSLQRLFLLQPIKTTEKQSPEHGATPVLTPLWKDHGVQGMGVTSRIPHLPTDSCHLSFSHAGLSDNVLQGSSIHEFHHQPEIPINKEAGRGKQGHGD